MRAVISMNIHVILEICKQTDQNIDTFCMARWNSSQSGVVKKVECIFMRGTCHHLINYRLYLHFVVQIYTVPVNFNL